MIKSVKTSSDSEDSNRSDEFKNHTKRLKIPEKRHLTSSKFREDCKFWILRKRLFGDFQEIHKNSVHTYLLAFSKRFVGMDYV